MICTSIWKHSFTENENDSLKPPGGMKRQRAQLKNVYDRFQQARNMSEEAITNVQQLEDIGMMKKLIPPVSYFCMHKTASEAAAKSPVRHCWERGFYSETFRY